MSIYLIDYENVNVSGLNGIETLTEADKVYIFYGANPGYIPFEKHILISKSQAEVAYLRVERSGKNYLDFQLATYSGYLVAMYPEREYIIVSRDTGFDSIVNFWNRNPEDRGVRFSRREAIVVPPSAAKKKESAESAVVKETPAAEAPSAGAEERGRGGNRNRRRGRGKGRSAVLAPKAPEIASRLTAAFAEEEEVLTQANAVASASEPIPESAESFEYLQESVTEEMQEEQTALLVTEESISAPAEQAEELAESTEKEITAGIDEAIAAEAEKEAEPTPEEEKKVAWGRQPTSFVSSQTVGVYVPGTAASGKITPHAAPVKESEPVLTEEQTLSEALSETLDVLVPISQAPAEEKPVSAEEILPEEPIAAGERLTEEVTARIADAQIPASGEKSGEEAPAPVALQETTEEAVAEEPVSEQPLAEQDTLPEKKPRRMTRRQNQRSRQGRKKMSEAKQEPASVPEETRAFPEQETMEPSDKREQISEESAESTVLTEKEPMDDVAEIPALPKKAERSKKSSAEKPKVLKLPERYKSRIREAVKEEGLSSGAYTQIYNRVLKVENKSRLNNELVKAFSQEKGGRIYKSILPIFEEYRKSLGEV